MLRHHLLPSLTLAALASGCGPTTAQLAGRAVLPAATFAEGPTSGQHLGETSIHGQRLPFEDAQPVQGFSALLIEDEQTILVLTDNGFGALENSADYHLRVYRLRVELETEDGGDGSVRVLSHFELSDPDRHLPFTIAAELTEGRVLTGADLDVESFQRAPDGTFWFGDEFGPFLLHTDAEGHLIEPPRSLPDGEGGELRSPQSPLSEESSAVRLMNAYDAQGRHHQATRRPVLSPHHLLLADEDDETAHPGRPSGASSELFDVTSLHRAGYAVVPWTVNDPERMRALITLGVDGLITDRPDLLRQVLEDYDADDDGAPDFLDEEGLIDSSRFDAQGHRGARGLRPENTLSAFESALDHLVSTLETDAAVTSDGVPILAHNPLISAALCRLADGSPLTEEPLIRSLTAEQIQSRYVCDRLLERFGESQRAERSLSPVASSYCREFGLADPFVMPTLEQLFDFVAFYEAYYRSGAGSNHSHAAVRAANAARARFNIEIKRDPTRPTRTISRQDFTRVLGLAIVAAGYEDRADVQSFDHGSLLELQASFPTIRSVYLVDDDTLRPAEGGRSPWLAGLRWPYGETARSHPFRVQTSGGIEGMALSPDGRRLLPILEKPLVGETDLRIYDFDLESHEVAPRPRRLALDPLATSVGDFVLFAPDRGLVIERDDREGDLEAYKLIVELGLGGPGEVVTRRPLVDLMRLGDPESISLPALPGDLGLGRRFALPFFTIEGLAVVDPRHLLVANDNNFPLSVGRHVGADRPDDNELILIELAEALAP